MYTCILNLLSLSLIMATTIGTQVCKVATINVRGLNNPVQRWNIFQSLQNINSDFYCLQETYGKATSVKQWKDEWPGDSYWCPTPRSDSCGVAILLNPNCQFEVVQVKNDNDGRVIALHVKSHNTHFQIINVYAPSKSSAKNFFFSNILNYDFQGFNLVLAGDFNCIEDPLYDRLDTFCDSSKCTIGMKELNILKTDYDLVDSWRMKNPNNRQYTWSNTSQTRQSRIDRIYVPTQWFKGGRSRIIPFPWSDHDIVITDLHIPKTVPRGHGTWKLNLSLLEDSVYKETIKSFLYKWKDKKTLFSGITQWWDALKHFIRGVSMQFSKNKNKQLKEQFLEADRLLKFEQEQDDPNIDNMRDAREIIQNYEYERNKGIFIRSKTQYYEEFERPTKYFYNLQNSNKQKSTIYELRHGDNVISDQTEILNISHSFYQELYTKQATCSKSQNKILQNINKSLTQEQRDALEQPLSVIELFKALLKMKPGKSPGIDGLPMEFYMVFWPEIKDEFLELVNECHDKLIMSKTMRTAVLSLLFKKGDKKLLKNWRPVSLLCVDYKIIAAALSLRLKCALRFLISTDQTCSIPGRTILSNLRLTRDIMSYARNKKLEGVILNLDQEKAFDRVDHDFLHKVMEKMNIGPYFRTWIKTLYAAITSNITNNGYLSAPVFISRGVRQGCPLSALLYVIVAETLGQAIRCHPDIRGFKIPGCNREVRISQYADDTSLFLFTPDAIVKALETIGLYELATGAKLNVDKTRAMRFGDLSKNKFFIPDFYYLKWVYAEGIKVLGITFFNDYLRTQNFNWEVQIRKLESALQNWKSRHLSLKGRAMIINTMALSKLWYLGAIISPSDSDFKAINSAIFDFLWHGMMCQIKRTICYLPIQKGGLGILNPRRQIRALHLKAFHYIRCENLDTFDAQWVYLARYWIGRRLGNHHDEWKFLSHSNNLPHSQHYPHYYHDFVEVIPKNVNCFRAVPLTSKSIYEMLSTQFYESEHPFTGETYFRMPGPYNWNNSTTVSIPWSVGWQLSYQGYNPFYHQDVIYKLRHQAIFTGLRAHTKFKNYKGLHTISKYCKVCGQPESIYHLFGTCHIARQIWKQFLPYFRKLLPNCNTLIQPHLMLGIFRVTGPPLADFPFRLAFTLSSIIVHTLWTSRVKHRNGGERPSFAKLNSKIRSRLIDIIKHKHRFFSNSRSMAVFKARFAIDDIFCSVSNTNQLTINI